MGANYAGISAFTLQRSEPDSTVGEMPVVVESWRGRADQRDTFLAKYPMGLLYGGGYIVRTSGRDDGAWSMVDITIGLAPDFTTDWPANGVSTKIATMSAKVTASGILAGETEVIAERSVSFYSPETRHAYFAAKKPSGAKYSTVLIATQPTIIRSVIKATGVASGQSITFPGLYAPAALVSALFMPTVDTVTDHQSPCIPGTPWYRCTDTVSRVLQGDSNT